MKCPYCEKRFSGRPDNCPNCGMYLKEQYQIPVQDKPGIDKKQVHKKIILIIALSNVVFFLALGLFVFQKTVKTGILEEKAADQAHAGSSHSRSLETVHVEQEGLIYRAEINDGSGSVADLWAGINEWNQQTESISISGDQPCVVFLFNVEEPALYQLDASGKIDVIMLLLREFRQNDFEFIAFNDDYSGTDFKISRFLGEGEYAAVIISFNNYDEGEVSFSIEKQDQESEISIQ